VNEVLERGYGQHAIAVSVEIRPNFSEKANIFISDMRMLRLGYLGANKHYVIGIDAIAFWTESCSSTTTCNGVKPTRRK
jgi:hypothetical protein